MLCPACFSGTFKECPECGELLRVRYGRKCAYYCCPGPLCRYVEIVEYKQISIFS